MGRVGSHRDWLRHIGGLTVQPEGQHGDQLSAARDRAQQVMLLAGALEKARGGRPRPGGRCLCAPARCQLSGLAGGPEACALAVELARAGVSLRAAPRPRTRPAAAGGDVSDLTARYLAAVRHAADAVWLCRRVQHACGGCWFSPAGPAAGACGRVLRVAHLLGDPAGGRRPPA